NSAARRSVDMSAGPVKKTSLPRKITEPYVQYRGGPMRICSFLPAATETLFALGLGDDLVAVSHECDFPPEARSRPKLTTALVDATTMSSAEIDEAVTRALVEGRATYRVDMDVLRAAQPDL